MFIFIIILYYRFKFIALNYIYFFNLTEPKQETSVNSYYLKRARSVRYKLQLFDPVLSKRLFF